MDTSGDVHKLVGWIYEIVVVLIAHDELDMNSNLYDFIRFLGEFDDDIQWQRFLTDIHLERIDPFLLSQVKLGLNLPPDATLKQIRVALIHIMQVLKTRVNVDHSYNKFMQRLRIGN